MANTTIKITQLPNIGNNLAANTLLPVVDTSGVAVTDKVSVGNVANFILTEAGNTLPAAFVSQIAYSVANAAQPNITSVGNLTGLTINDVSTLYIGGGSDGYVLQTDGAGNLNWSAQAGAGNGSPGGSNTQIQFNDSGLFGGNSGFTFDKTHGALASLKIDTATLYHLAGTVVENADLTHGATSALIIPANGNTTNPAQLNNFYGNVIIQAGTDADHIKGWTFGSDGTLTFPDNSGEGWPIREQRFGMGNIGAWLDGEWTIGEFSGNVGGGTGIRIDPAIEGPTGMSFPSSVNAVTQPVSIYSTSGAGIQLYSGNSATWNFDGNGGFNLPTSGTIRSTNSGSINNVSNNFIQLQWVDSGNVNLPDPNGTQGPTNWLYVDSGGINIEANVNYELANTSYSWSFNNSGTFTKPNNVYENTTNTVTCNPGGPTVILSSVNSSIHTMKLIIQVEGRETSLNYDTQACEMLVARSYRNNNVIGSVYGLTYTSNSPLATFNAAYNSTTNMIDVTCTPTSAQEPVYVRLTTTQITTAD